jgi:hypothetical protein
MANWNELLIELNRGGSSQDGLRRKYLKKLSGITGRNVIAYYSGWLQKPTAPALSIIDNDKNGFMNAIYKLDCSKGLDLILHTPGGETAATESIVDYLRNKFNINIRIIVPQLALSAGTMIACAGKEIVMGKQSSLGPIDPQLGGVPAHGVIEEFQNAAAEIAVNPAKIPLWQAIIAKYPPTLIGESQKSIQWAESMVRTWLSTGMFHGVAAATAKPIIDTILQELGSHALTLSHARHLSEAKCRSIGLKVFSMESDQRLQDAILTAHHAYMLSFEGTPATKIIENQNGGAYIQSMQTLIINK